MMSDEQKLTNPGETMDRRQSIAGAQHIRPHGARLPTTLLLACFALACGDDASLTDASVPDGQVSDGAASDSNVPDASPDAPTDAGPGDTGRLADSATDGGSDAGPPPRDGGPVVFTGCEAEAPARCWFIAKDGSDDAAGTMDEPLRNIWTGIGEAGPGDYIYVREGRWTRTEDALAWTCGEGWSDRTLIPLVANSIYGVDGDGASCPEQWPTHTVASGEAGRPITLSALPGEAVLLDMQPEMVLDSREVDGSGRRVQGLAVAYIGQVAHWRIRGFEMNGGMVNFDYSPMGGPSERTHHIEIVGNDIHHNIVKGDDNPGLVRIDRSNAPHDITIRNNDLHDHWDASEGVTGWDDTRDTIHFGAVTVLSNQDYLGVDALGTERVLIENNRMWNLPQMVFLKNSSLGPVEILGNEVWNAQTLGVFSGANTRLENNTITNVSHGAIVGFGAAVDPSVSGTNVQLINNTFVGMQDILLIRNGDGHRVEGNLFFGFSEPGVPLEGSRAFILGVRDAPSGPLSASRFSRSVVENNCVISSDSNPAVLARLYSEYSSAAESRAALGYPVVHDVHDQTAEEVFVNAAGRDFTQRADSPCLGRGAP